MDIHDRLNTLLKESGMTRYRLSKKCNIPTETLTGIFKRGRTPTFASLEAICNGLGITLSEFFSENEILEMTPELKNFYDIWRCLTEEQQNLIIQLMKQMRS